MLAVRLCTRAAVLLAVALVITPPALGQAADPYTVTGVPVDATADNAADAQRMALEQGQRAAAQRLIDRLTLPQDREGPPPQSGFDEARPAPQSEQLRQRAIEQYGLSEAEAAALVVAEASDGAVLLDEQGERLEIAPVWDGTGLPPVSADEAAAMIAGLEIGREQRSATRYIAELTVSFDRRAVAAYFDRYDVPHVQSQARPVLVVPVLSEAGGDKVWEGEWYEAWKAGGFAHALAPMIALGSRTERLEAGPINSAPEGGAETGREGTSLLDAPLSETADAWIEEAPVDRVIEQPLGRDVLTASEALALETAPLRELAELYGVSQVAVIAAARTRTGVRAQGVLVDLAGEEPLYEDVAAVGAPGFPEAARLIVESRETDWKERAVVRDRSTGMLQVTVLFGRLEEWLGLRTDIAAAALVTNARLDALSRQGAVMTLTHRGGIDQLRGELAERGVFLEEREALGWTAQRRS